MSQDKSWNSDSWKDDIFGFSPNRQESNNPEVRVAMMQQAAWDRYSVNYLDGTTIYKGVVLHVEPVVNTGTSSEPRLRAKMKVRIRELHALIPEVCGLENRGEEEVGKIKMHPWFIGPVQSGAEVAVGDIVRVSFAKGPKFGIQAGGIYHNVYMKKAEAGVSSVRCKELRAEFDGRRSSQQLGAGGTGRTATPAVVRNSQQRRAELGTKIGAETTASIDRVFRSPPTDGAAYVSSEWGQRCAICTGRWINEDQSDPANCSAWSTGIRSDGSGESHGGADLAVAEGTSVLSPFAGTVVEVSNDPTGWGRYVTLEAEGAGGDVITYDNSNEPNGHRSGGKYRVRYAHLSSASVVVGASITIGQRVGLSGKTGRVSGAHLHVEVFAGGVEQNPRDYFPVRSFTNSYVANDTRACTDDG